MAVAPRLGFSILAAPSMAQPLGIFLVTPYTDWELVGVFGSGPAVGSFNQVSR